MKTNNEFINQIKRNIQTITKKENKTHENNNTMKTLGTKEKE